MFCEIVSVVCGELWGCCICCVWLWCCGVDVCVVWCEVVDVVYGDEFDSIFDVCKVVMNV